LRKGGNGIRIKGRKNRGGKRGGRGGLSRSVGGPKLRKGAGGMQIKNYGKFKKMMQTDSQADFNDEDF